MNETVRKNMLTEADVKLLAELIANRPPVPACVDMCKYEKQMEVLDRWIANDTLRKERWERIRAGVIIGVTLAILTAIGKGSVWMVELVGSYWKGH